MDFMQEIGRYEGVMVGKREPGVIGLRYVGFAFLAQHEAERAESTE
jgi:hypothetical protein